MAIEDAIDALIEHWDDVIARLDAIRIAELAGLAAGLGGPDHTRAVTRIGDLLTATLPPGHPARRALARGYLYASAAPDWSRLRAQLLAAVDRLPPPGQALPPEPASVGDTGAGDPGASDSVTSRLLLAPALTADEVRRRGADPADPALIRLASRDGAPRWPGFQFTAADGARGTVREINILLGVEADPVGVADWWLGDNAWLDAPPASLLGRVPDNLLVSAARAVGEEV